MRVLFVINRCKHIHLDYVRAIAAHCRDNRVLISYLGNDWLGDTRVVQPDESLPHLDILCRTRIREDQIDMAAFDAALRSSIHKLRPQIIHVLPYLHDRLVVHIRGVLREVDQSAKLIYETRDPTGLIADPTDELAALQCVDGFIFVSVETADYIFNRYLFEPAPYLVVRQSEFYAKRDQLPAKLSASDGRVHVVLMGTFHQDPSSARNYEQLIREFVAHTGETVLHTYPHISPPYLDRLQQELGGRLVNHAKVYEVTFSENPSYTSTMGQYDFNLVAHLNWRQRNERAVLRYCNPTKATSPLILADLPFLCTGHYRGIIELIDQYGCGFVYHGWSDLNKLFHGRDRWTGLIEGAQIAARELCLESQAVRVVDFYRSLM